MPTLGRAPPSDGPSASSGAQPMRNRRRLTAARSSACASRSTACRSPRAKRCSTACARTSAIIVGAYIDGDGGVCPMLAAHRCGGRTDFLSFAQAPGTASRARGARRAGRRRARAAILRRAARRQPRERDASVELRRGDRASTALRSVPPAHAAGVAPTRPTPSGEILAAASVAELGAATPRERAAPSSDSASPGRTNMISGTMHAGEVSQQEAHGLGDVLGADHLLGGAPAP